MNKPLPDDYVSSIVNQDWVQQTSNKQWRADFGVFIMESEKRFLQDSEDAKPLIWSSLEIEEHEKNRHRSPSRFQFIPQPRRN